MLSPYFRSVLCARAVLPLRAVLRAGAASQCPTSVLGVPPYRCHLPHQIGKGRVAIQDIPGSVSTQRPHHLTRRDLVFSVVLTVSSHLCPLLRIGMARLVSELDIQQFAMDGAVCLRRVFSQRWVDEVRRGIDLNQAAPSPFGESLKVIPAVDWRSEYEMDWISPPD